MSRGAEIRPGQRPNGARPARLEGPLETGRRRVPDPCTGSPCSLLLTHASSHGSSRPISSSISPQRAAEVDRCSQFRVGRKDRNDYLCRLGDCAFARSPNFWTTATERARASPLAHRSAALLLRRAREHVAAQTAQQPVHNFGASCRTGRSSWRYTVSVTWLEIPGCPVFSETSVHADGLEHTPDVPDIERSAHGRGEEMPSVRRVRSRWGIWVSAWRCSHWS